VSAVVRNNVTRAGEGGRDRTVLFDHVGAGHSVSAIMGNPERPELAEEDFVAGGAATR
jgi:hypothetical protein